MEQSINSSMATHLGFRRRRFRLFRPLDGRSALSSTFRRRQFHRLATAACDPLDRARDAAERRAKIRQVDHRKQQACDPEYVYMGEQRQEAKDRDDLELQFLRFVRHPLRQRMQLQV